jgi:hypothetical protein
MTGLLRKVRKEYRRGDYAKLSIIPLMQSKSIRNNINAGSLSVYFA